MTPPSFAAFEDKDLASLPVNNAVISPEPSFVAAVRAERHAGTKALSLCSRIARVERLDRER